jgi:hypothetical protein
MPIRLHDQERGAALIVALLVTFVVLLLSLFVVQLSLHNTTASSYDRMRVQSLTAAEAGVNDFFNVLQRTPPERLPCNIPGIGLHLGPVTGSIQIFPGTASYAVEVHYYDASTPPVELDCALLGQDNPPAAASVASTGTTNGTVPRKMQAWVNLIKHRSGGFNAAIVADKGMCVSGNYTVDDPGTSFSADLYVNSGNLCIGSQQGGNMTVEGKIFVHDGSVSLGGNTAVRNDVWAWSSVSLADTQTSVQGSVISSSSSLSGNGSIGGSAKAGTTITCNNKTNPAAIGNCSPPVLNGQGLVIRGQPILRDSAQSAPPPATSVPPVCWTAVWADCVATQQDWINAGYTIELETSCTLAQTYLQNLMYTGNLVVRVTGCSELVLNQVNVQINGNLAIFTDGRIRFDTRNVFTGNGGNLYFIVGYQPNVNPTSCLVPAQSYAATTDYDILFNNNPDLRSLHVSMYTPGAMIFNNQTKNGGGSPPLTGQLLGGQFCSSNYFSMQFAPVLIPTVSPIAGFGQDVLWVREVA